MRKGIGPLTEQIERCDEHTAMQEYYDQLARNRQEYIDRMPTERLYWLSQAERDEIAWQRGERSKVVVSRDAVMCSCGGAAVRVTLEDGSSYVESHADGIMGSDVPCGR